MNLYVIEFKHTGGEHKGILTHFIGKNDEEVYNFLASNDYSDGLNFCTNYADSERDARQESEAAGDAYRQKIISQRGTLYQTYSDDDEYSSYGSPFSVYGWKLLQENITPAEIKTLLNLGVEIRPKGIKVKNITKNSLNKQLREFNGYGKTDTDFHKMIDDLHGMGLSLEDGKIEYSDNMTQKHYNYKVVSMLYDEDGEPKDTKIIGYLSATQYFLNGLDNPYEILVYIS